MFVVMDPVYGSCDLYQMVRGDSNNGVIVNWYLHRNFCYNHPTMTKRYSRPPLKRYEYKKHFYLPFLTKTTKHHHKLSLLSSLFTGRQKMLRSQACFRFLKSMIFKIIIDHWIIHRWFKITV